MHPAGDHRRSLRPNARSETAAGTRRQWWRATGALRCIRLRLGRLRLGQLDGQGAPPRRRSRRSPIRGRVGSAAGGKQRARHLPGAARPIELAVPAALDLPVVQVAAEPPAAGHQDVLQHADVVQRPGGLRRCRRRATAAAPGAGRGRRPAGARAACPTTATATARRGGRRRRAARARFLERGEAAERRPAEPGVVRLGQGPQVVVNPRLELVDEHPLVGVEPPALPPARVVGRRGPVDAVHVAVIDADDDQRATARPRSAPAPSRRGASPGRHERAARIEQVLPVLEYSTG